MSAHVWVSLFLSRPLCVCADSIIFPYITITMARNQIAYKRKKKQSNQIILKSCSKFIKIIKTNSSSSSRRNGKEPIWTSIWWLRIDKIFKIAHTKLERKNEKQKSERKQIKLLQMHRCGIHTRARDHSQIESENVIGTIWIGRAHTTQKGCCFYFSMFENEAMTNV